MTLAFVIVRNTFIVPFEPPHFPRLVIYLVTLQLLRILDKYYVLGRLGALGRVLNVHIHPRQVQVVSLSVIMNTTVIIVIIIVSYRTVIIMFYRLNLQIL